MHSRTVVRSAWHCSGHVLFDPHSDLDTLPFPDVAKMMPVIAVA
jgi:hypothetical protein